MAIKDKSQLPPLSRKQLPPFSPEDEKKAQKELDRLRRNKVRGFEGKTLWDWLQLLGVPVFLAFATIGFGFVQFYLAGQQHDSDQRIANQQHAVDQQNALEQQRATILQTYIDNIQELLLKDNLRGSKPSDEVAILARARTLTALQGLDPDRKGRLVQFLWEAQLIGFEDHKLKPHDPIISLDGAFLNSAILSGADLDGAHLDSAHLDSAHLSYAFLSGIHLGAAILSGVDLEHAHLEDAHLEGAHLDGAFLDGAILNEAKLTHANLSRASLSTTDLYEADLSSANLSHAAITQQRLDQVYSCAGATLPQGLTCNKTPTP